MDNRKTATPLLLRGDQEIALNSVPLNHGDGDSVFSEQFIQELAFNHPNCLPIEDIDQSYQDLVPICMELGTPAGKIDALYATPNGRIVLLEAKLWRNPEARRKVVSQILDYSRAVSQWNYEDLQREVARATGETGNVLYDKVSAGYPDVEEARFVDEVQKSLEHGRFLLLIVGDGIREGAGAIAEFIERSGNLEFTFGLVELSLYKHKDEILVVPQVLAKTTIISRSVVRLTDGVTLDTDEDEDVPPQEMSDSQQFYLDFWTEFLAELRLDDATQPRPNPSRKGFLAFAMPPSRSVARVATYFYKAHQNVGVYLSFTKGDYAPMVYKRLAAEAEEINSELGIEVSWQAEPDSYMIEAHRNYPNIHAPENRQEIKTFLADSLNRFVNVFRPRLEAIAKEVE